MNAVISSDRSFCSTNHNVENRDFPRNLGVLDPLGIRKSSIEIHRASRRLEKAFVTSPRLNKTGAEFPISRKFQFYRSSLARDFFLFRFGWEKREKQIDLIRVTTNIPPRYFLGLGDSRFNWLSRLSIIPRNKYTNIAVPNSSEIPSLGPLQTATLSRFSVLSSDGFPPF